METTLMRLGFQARHRASSDARDPCPCCFGALDRVKQAIGEVSRLMAQSPLHGRDECLETVLATLRSEGQTVFRDLQGALQGVAPPPDGMAFQASIRAAQHAIGQGAPALDGGDGQVLMALGTAFCELGEALARLTSELRANLEETSRRTARPTICQSVDVQQKLVDL